MAETPVLRHDDEAATLEPFPTGLNRSSREFAGIAIGPVYRS